MDSSIARRVDYGLLDSLEWSGESHTLGSLLDQFGSSLPHVVKVFQGFCGDASSGTIDSGQILILHSLHKETKILAKDAEETELCIPRDFQVKVEMIPKNSLEESTSVRELLQTFPKYFRALSDIPSHGITSGSMFKIIRQKGYGCFECLEIINDGEEREVRLPFSLKGRFQALQDNREFLIDEVYAEEKDNLEDGEPVNIHFVKSCLSGISVPGLSVASLYDLGTVRLVGEHELQTVFATILSSENVKTLAVFPKDLEITVHSAVTSEHYESVRRTIKDTQNKTLKRIERLNKLSLYQARNPVRQFSQIELEPPALPGGKAKKNSARQAAIDSTADNKGNNSAPPPPPKVPLETKHQKTLKKAPSVPTPEPPSQNTASGKDNFSLKRPTYKPPDIPHQSQPPLPPKKRSHSLKDTEQDITPDHVMHKTQEIRQQDGQDSVPESAPPIPPPRLRRRQKSLGRRQDINKSALVSTCYEQMDGFGCEQEYVEMNRSWIEQEGTLEEIFGDTIVDGDEEDTTATEKATEGCKVSGSEVNNNVPRKVEEMVVLSNDADDQTERERVDSMDYENTKELKLDRLKKAVSGKTVEQNNTDDQIERERVDSMDYENTKELKLDRLKKAVSGKTAPEKDLDDQRVRVDSMDYENTKELKLERLKKEILTKTVLNNDADDQRERIDSMDYENTKELKLERLKKAVSGKSVPRVNDANDQRERSDSENYENTPNVKPPGVIKDGETTLPSEARQNRAPNTNELEGKEKAADTRSVQGEDFANHKLSGKDGVTKTEQILTLVHKSQASSPCSKDTDNVNAIERASAEDGLDRTPARSKLEVLSEPGCMKGKTVAITEQFLKELNSKLSREVPSGNDATIQAEVTRKESSAEDANSLASDEIYYTTMAENVADPSYYTAMARNSLLQGDVYEEMNAGQDDATYMPMNVSHTEDDSIYENDVRDPKGADSDEMDDYEKVDSVRTPRKKRTQLAIDKEVDEKHFSDPYEEVDIIQQIESSLDKKGRRVGSYEEIDLPLNPGSNRLDVVSRERPGSDSYEDIDFPTNPGSCYLTLLPPTSPVAIPSDNPAPPTPPQRRAKKLRKNQTGEVKAGDSINQPEVLSSSPKSCTGQIGNQTEKHNFVDLESLQIHMALKESERQQLFEKALLFKNKKQQPPNSESPETTQQESSKDIVTGIDKVADQHVKSRPPAPPPPRKPVNYLDVEPTRKPGSKFLKQKPQCNYSEIIGKVKANNSSSSREDDMEYIDDIELHYVQKEAMEREKRRKERIKERNINAKDPDANNDVLTKKNEKDDGKISSSNGVHRGDSGKSEDESSVAANIQKFQLNSSKDDLQDSKKPVIPKPSPKKPAVKKKPSRSLSAPIVSKNDEHEPLTKSISSHDSNTPIRSQNPSYDVTKSTAPICSSSRSPGVYRPIIPQSPSRDANKSTTSEHQSHDTNTPTTSICSSSPDDRIPIIPQSPSRDANKSTTSEHQSRDTNTPTTSSHQPSRAINKPILTRHSSEKPAVAKKPLVKKRSLNPPPKPRRTFAAVNTHEAGSKANIQNTPNTQMTCDTPPPHWNGKNIQTAVQNNSTSEEKATYQRTKPPKPLPRMKSLQN